MRVKIIATPKEKAPVAPINPFSNPYSDTMKYGGPLENDRANGNMRLDTKWDWMRQPDGNYGYAPSPYNTSSRTLPEAEDGEGNINAEKQEQVMGDFNGDGMPVLMNVNGKPHTAGGKDVSVPNGSFIFSDTQNLRIKSPDVLKSFGMSKPSTPAEIAKKYDLQKFKAIIDNPEADDLDKSTAQLMYGNYVNKLNALAAYQESIKEQKGISKPGASMQMPGQPPMRYGGDLPIAQNGLRYTESFDQNNDNSIPFPGSQPVYTAPPSHISGRRTQPNHLIGSGFQNPSTIGMGDSNIWGSSQVPPNALPNTDMQPVPVSGARQLNVSPDNPNMPSTSVPALPNFGSSNHHIPAGMNPDQMRNFFLALKAGSYPDYTPIRQIAHGAVAQPVFMDPTRAKAALVEQGNQAAYLAALSGQGPISRANAIAASGQVGAQAADVEGRYANENTQIANRANEGAVQEYNRLFQQQQGYNKDYNEEMANALKDRYGAHSAIANEYLKGMYEDRARKQSAYNANYVNPFYSYDEQGFIHPKTAEQRSAILGITGSQPGGQNTEYMTPEQVEHYIKTYNVTADEANKLRSKMAYYAMRGPSTTMKSNPYGMPQTITQRGYGNEIQNPYMSPSYVPAPEEKYGGNVSQKRKVRIVATP